MTAVGLLLLLGGCERWQGGSTVAGPLRGLPDEGAIAAVPLGDVAGASASTLASAFPNPYGGNAQAIEEGKALFVKMNCAGCHGYGAKGSMGPDLTDKYWRYRGVPVAIYKSIYEGRPQGMPAWNPALPAQDIWKLVAYIESLGGSFPAADYQAAQQGDRPGEQVAQPQDQAEPQPQNQAEQRAEQPKPQPRKEPDGADRRAPAQGATDEPNAPAAPKQPNESAQ